MKCTRFLAVLLALTFALCVFAACGEAKKEYSMPVKVTTRNANGEVVETATISYDKDGMTILETGDSISRKTVLQRTEEKKVLQIYYDGVLFYNAEIQLDSQGRPVKGTAKMQKTKVGPHGIAGVLTGDDNINYEGEYEYRYNEDGSRTYLSTEYSSTWGGTGRQETKYDANGNPTELWCYAGEELSYYVLYEYNAEGKLTKKTLHNPDGNGSSTDQYEYDGNGNLTKETSYSEENQVGSFSTYEYDANGNLTKCTYYYEGSVEYTYEFEYDNVKLTEAQHEEFLGVFPSSLSSPTRILLYHLDEYTR